MLTGWALPSGLHALRSRDYRRYIAGHVVSHTGSSIENTATSWLLYQLTDSAVMLGIGGLCRTVPIVLLTLVGGALADQFSRRAILLFTQSALGLLSLVIGVLVLTGGIEPWHVLLFNVLTGTLSAFEVPARQSLFPSLVTPDLVPSAVKVNTSSARLAGLVGPAVSGLLIASYGNAVPFLVNAASYLALLWALVQIRSAAATATPGRGPLLSTIGEGLMFVRRHPVLRLLIGAEVLVSLFGHNNALLTVFARDVLEAGPQGLGLLRSSIAAGALLSMFLLLVLRDVERKGLLMLVAGLVYASSLAAFGLSQALWLSSLALFVLGIADAAWTVTRNTMAQVLAGDQTRGRVISLVALVSRGSTQGSEMQSGLALTALGPGGAVLMSAGIVLATVLGISRRPEMLSARSHDVSHAPRASAAV